MSRARMVALDFAQAALVVTRAAKADGLLVQVDCRSPRRDGRSQERALKRTSEGVILFVAYRDRTPEDVHEDLIAGVLAANNVPRGPEWDAHAEKLREVLR